MLPTDSHLSDQDLLLAADGELSARRDGQVRRHLQACWTCRKRMADLEITISDFVGTYHSNLNHSNLNHSNLNLSNLNLSNPNLDPRAPPENGRDALLRRRLTAAADSRPARNDLSIWRRRAVASFALLVVVLLAGTFQNWRYQQTASLEAGVVPNPALTPGEATTASRGDVCPAQAAAETSAKVPDDLKEAVFSEYGMKNAPRDAYEVDFLITPELGGSASMRNLWPEPYDRKAWSAHAKDKLEDRLHSLVCRGDLDLATAQHEIASNWVSAYKKYVGVGHPI